MVILDTKNIVQLKEKMHMLGVYNDVEFEEKAIAMIKSRLSKKEVVNGWWRTSTIELSSGVLMKGNLVTTENGTLHHILSNSAESNDVPKYTIESTYKVNKMLKAGKRTVLKCIMEIRVKQYMRLAYLSSRKIINDDTDNCIEYSCSGSVEVYRDGKVARKYELNINRCGNDCNTEAIISRINELVCRIGKHEIKLDGRKKVKDVVKFMGVVKSKGAVNENISTVIEMKKVSENGDTEH